MDNSEQYLKVALEAAKKSGILFKKNFGVPKKISQKGGSFHDSVTEVDFNIEKLIRGIIHKNFPEHKIIGEEYGAERITANDLIWIIDPIDGTTNFIKGLPLCSISIALWDKKGPLIAAVSCPELNYLFTAMRNKGACLNGKKIFASKTNRLDRFFVGFGWGHNQNSDYAKLIPKLTKIFAKVRSLGGTTLDMCFVGKGTYDAHIQKKCSIWDIAAAALIVTEAGGKVTDSFGRPITLNSTNIIASNGRLHNQLLTQLKKISS